MTDSSPPERLEQAIQTVIVGQDRSVRVVIASLLAGGHVLINDVPGTGKTMLAKSLAKAIGATYRRIQFTPDLLPSDITGVTVYHPAAGSFEFKQGPIFTQLLLADEINRATPRTQSALLESMEERQVTIDGVAHPLGPAFFVIATQNPIEQHGTFPLPEAQLDRFLTCIHLGYPSEANEVRILGEQVVQHPIEQLQPVLGVEELLTLQQRVTRIHVDDDVRRYMVQIAASTRHHDEVSLGASPRGSLALQRLAQAIACLEGRDHVRPEHVKRVAADVLAHRLIVKAQARLAGVTGRHVVAEVLDRVPVPVD